MAAKKFHVFIVDDDPSFRFITKKLCEKEPSIGRIEDFEDIYDALRQIMLHKKSAENLPDVILLDLNFPTLNGWEFLEGFVDLQVSLAKKIPVFVISSSLLNSDRARAKEIDIVKGFFSKPITLEQVTSIMQSLDHV
ncbi:response regulator [Imperialibacter roseus]|jgi:CheY-like chemotaxis protein|uniref:Response regulator n=1 Tax=Imperialibacter roseus TaxID=1324217 RepID=A0ABZ0IVM3_9BACT|nr:response regulator [Imperialibacter roseus]WOK08836.1 response regulator [Imperialibacter roseus]|tara:strand:+ start:15445 stop:15855 length:411 start_codon:yes stop_codon:yes gene_type:complete